MAGLPNARNTNYTAATPVLSNDLDDIEDCIVNGGHGPIVRKIPVSAGVWSATSGFSAQTWIPNAAADEYAMPLEVYSGERITAVVAKVLCHAGDAYSLSVFRYDPTANVVTQLGATQHSAGTAGASEDLVVSGLAEDVSASDGYNYYALVIATAVGTPPTFYQGGELYCEFTP